MTEQVIVAGLNDAQRQAVTSPVGHMMVLAGAGSGKTRVLVHRIAWLVRVAHVPSQQILAVTFTNKAANEMRGRIESLVPGSTHAMWVGTFHGLAHRLLRAHYQQADLPASFQILDSDDQHRLIRQILKNNQYDEVRWPPKEVQSFINRQKDDGLRSHRVSVASADRYTSSLVEIYRLYEQACQQFALLDFAELLLRAFELWDKNPDLLQHYQSRFPHILVDEFQDTNLIQYMWLKQLVGQTGHMMIVGDDDQSIYGWRGAQIKNIQRFNKDFPGEVIRLEQNYRSSAVILEAANALIGHNTERMGKSLWTSGDRGDLISLYAAFNEIDEARFIAERIKSWVDEGGRFSDIVVLYRSNAQSRILEETLVQMAIPYRIYGGLRFFERAEIKDALGYLRLLSNRDDDTAFERIVNTPARGLGERTLQLLRDHAQSSGISLWQSSKELLANHALSARATNALAEFLKLIDHIASLAAGLNLTEQTECVLRESGLREALQQERGERMQVKLENLAELVSAAQQFSSQLPAEELHLALPHFLAHVTLEAGEQESDVGSDSIQLMTLHAAKGLEFPLVFLSGLEDGLFPHRMAQESPGRAEEERRLCYVGMTRAMKKLYLTYAEKRRLHGQEKYLPPSRFIREIPSDLIAEVRLKSTVSRVSTLTNHTTRSVLASDTGFRIGQRVSHPIFGEGIVMNYEGSGAQARIQVNFLKAGTKWLIASMAKLEACTA